MLDAEEREGFSRGRLDLLLEQLGADVGNRGHMTRNAVADADC